MAIKSCSLVYVCGGTIVLLLSPLLFDTLLQGRYNEGLRVLPGTLVYCIWFGLTILAENHLLCAEKARATTAALLVGLVVNIGLNAMLLPWLGLTGAITATAIANAVALLITLRLAQLCGLEVDQGTRIMICLPLVLLFGWQVSAAALLMLAAVALRRGIIFDAVECEMMGGAGLRFREFVGRISHRR